MSLEDQVRRLRWQLRGLWIALGLFFVLFIAAGQVSQYNLCQTVDASPTTPVVQDEVRCRKLVVVDDEGNERGSWFTANTAQGDGSPISYLWLRSGKDNRDSVCLSAASFGPGIAIYRSGSRGAVWEEHH